MTTAAAHGRAGHRLATAAMGTRFELLLLGPDERLLQAAGEAALERIEELHRELTRFEPSSLLGHLRRSAPLPIPVDTATFRLFATVEAIRVASGGAFDPGSGDRGLRLDPLARTISLATAEVALDLGAIAKGHAIDEAAAVLRAAGVEDGFLHGGTSSAIGLGPAGWQVALGDDGPAVRLERAALSLSAAAPVRSGQRVSHVRDPRTGLPVAGARRAAVVGPSAVEADAWSTAILVLGHRPAALGGEWRVWLSETAGDWTELR